MRVRNSTLAVFLASEVVVTLLGALAYSEERSYPGNGAMLGAIILAIPLLLEMAGWFRMPTFMYVWASLAVGLHTFGLVWGMYDSVWWWDEMTHLISSSMVSVIAVLGLFLFDTHSLKIKVPRWAYPMMILVFSIFIGVVWEIAEFTGDLLASTRMQYSLSDTLSDCYVDILGGLTSSLLWVMWLWKDPNGELANSAQSPLIDLFDKVF